MGEGHGQTVKACVPALCQQPVFDTKRKSQIINGHARKTLGSIVGRKLLFDILSAHNLQDEKAVEGSTASEVSAAQAAAEVGAPLTQLALRILVHWQPGTSLTQRRTSA